MPENLTDAFAAYADALTPDRAPDYTGVTRALRRRRQRQASAGVTVTVVVLVVVGAAFTRAGHGARTATVAQPSTPNAPVTQQATSAQPPVAPEVYARLRAAAVRMAAGNGDLHPTRLEAVAVADVDAADTAVSGSVNGKPVKRAGYVVEVAGHFVCRACSVPFGAMAPTGTVANSILLAGTFRPVEGGMSDHWVDLTTLGKPFDLTPASTLEVLPEFVCTAAVKQVQPGSWCRSRGRAGRS